MPTAIEEQLPGVDYSIDSPPPWSEFLLLLLHEHRPDRHREAILLGFQNYVSLWVPLSSLPTFSIGKLTEKTRKSSFKEEKAKLIQTMVFVSGINTLLQVNFGTRLPVVIGSSQTFILPTLSIIFRQRCSDILDPHEHEGHTGALIIASSLQISFGFLGIWGVVVRYLSPLAAVPLVTLAGLGGFYVGFPLAAKCVEIGLPAIILLVFLSQCVEEKESHFRSVCLTITVVIVWVYAFFLTVAGAYKHAKPSTQFSCRADRADLIGASPW
ncbi:unnamed protein product [Spirodela intermedia]|uniref:Uncharacterized protein n=1 Tax=Spirodela intermedia TaxID=51605 RepID=A0ABN7ECG7_SPIIN|nr:unnamed protein product [Spirodela intermedia]